MGCEFSQAREPERNEYVVPETEDARREQMNLRQRHNE
jgi:hypothetical protein